MTILLLGAVLLLCLLPSLVFLGFWYGLGRMQRSSMLARTSARAGGSDPAVTWNDVVDAYADPQQSLISTSVSSRSASRDDRCPTCATETDSVGSFCHGCLRKLE
ncbi:zinc ribbon domain-containing protein [Haloterrigena salifodinae]|uniref:Zinc ribbon domain-containing protein n=1 Tax=Haloterrigena salifodinae TaxID=2675099 RepID=A0A8T8DYN1_9EURY|nr:zinc ribbon domain-containing protein [Haloterrigena salifodinae]QRV14684.1 zinc ribbon domain-containing protein [Haloterrigena salifodinae]